MHEVLFAERNLGEVVGVVVRGEVEARSIRFSTTTCWRPIWLYCRKALAGVRVAVRIAVSRKVEADTEPCWHQGTVVSG